MQSHEFMALVARCRSAQKRYFKTRSPVDLDYSKALERQVDAAIREASDGPSLFDREREAESMTGAHRDREEGAL